MVKIFYNNARAPQLQELDKEREGSWIWVESPSRDELDELAERFNLENDLLYDAIDPNESPRMEREDNVTYIFTRYCLVEDKRILTVPMLIIYADKVLITITTRPFPPLRLFTEQKLEFLTTQKAKLMLQLLNQVNRSYLRELNIVSKQIWQIRTQLNKIEIRNEDFVTFIDIEEVLNDFVSALVPMKNVLRNLLAHSKIRFYEDDRDLIEDLQLSTDELIELSNLRLKTITNIREAYSTIMANNLNRVFKLMTSITILMGVPTIVASLYGMNIALPYDHEPRAFLMVVLLIVAFLATLSWIFKRNKWF